MRVLWQRAPLAAGAIVDALKDEAEWSPRTVKTLINRLVRKRAVGYEEEGRAYLYSPLVNERDCVRLERTSFLRRVYSGSMLPMLAGFLEDERPSRSEIEELKALLDRKGKR